MQIVRDEAGGQYLVSLDEGEFTSIASLIVLWEDTPVVPYFWPDGRPEGIDELSEQVDTADLGQSSPYELTWASRGWNRYLSFYALHAYRSEKLKQRQ
jgi:hypothetical protein